MTSEPAPDAVASAHYASSVPDQTAVPPGSDASAPAPAEAPHAESFAEALEQDANLPKPLSRGELVEGIITATSPTRITVDVDGKGEGIITSNELEKMSRQTLQSLKVGEPIMVYVVNPHDPRTGHMILSALRAMEEMDWRTAEEYRQNQQTYETQIAGYNKGGLIVRFGRLRGFVPQSQMSRRRALNENSQEAWSEMVNQSIVVKVMEVDRSRNRLILSERMANGENREKRKSELIEDLTVGETREGRVVSLEDFGAFVDISGAEGRIHLTEMSYQHSNHPRDVLKVDQEIDEEVISVDPHHLELTADHAELSDQQHLSLTDTAEKLRRDPNTSSFADELTDYLNGNYRDVLRRLERLENSSRLADLSLKVMCLLQMEARNETIGNTRPREYLRDRILNQFKQLDETDELRTAIEWLEAFCYGHELPVRFWSMTSE